VSQGGSDKEGHARTAWRRSLDGHLPFGKFIVAIANKHARQIWAMLARDVDYDPHACLNHPTGWPRAMHQRRHTTNAA
jgi:hypothetical protein